MSNVEPIKLADLSAFANADVRYIYVLHEEGDLTHCKVGRARHPEWRRMELQSGNRRRLVISHVWRVSHRNSATVYETAIHAKLANVLVAGEWFRLPPDIAARAAEQTFLEFEI